MTHTGKVLLITESYPPILNSAGRLFSELADSLEQQGIDVLVLTEKPYRYVADEANTPSESQDQLVKSARVIRLPGFPRLRSVLVFRYLEQLFKMFMYFVVGLFYGYKRDVIVYAPPLPIALAGVSISKLHRRRCIVNVQDLYPETAISLGVMKKRFLIALARTMEAWVYRYSDAITVHSEGNKNYIVKRGVNPQKIYVVYNWIDLNKYSPGPLNNGFRAKHNLGNKFVISYAGVVGLAQDLEPFLEAAIELRADEQVFFVLAGDGVGYKAIKERAKSEQLRNILFLSHQNEPEYVKLLRSSDLCLVTLVKELLTPAIPGKLQGIMAVGRPVICSVPESSGAKAVVEEAGCGVWIDPHDKNSLIRAITALRNNKSREIIGINGRKHAQQFFEREKCTQAYFDLLEVRQDDCVDAKKSRFSGQGQRRSGAVQRLSKL